MSEEEKSPEEEPVDAEVVPEDEAKPPPAPEAGGALVVQEQHGSTQLIQASTPGETVRLATEVAKALNDVIVQQGLRTQIGSAKVVQPDGSTKSMPKYHTNIEGWQTLATLLGVVPDIVWVRRVVGPDGQPELTRYAVKETTRKYEYLPNNQRRLAQETIREYMREGYSYEARAIVVRNGVVVGSGEAICSRSEERWAEADDSAVKSMAQTRAQSRALKTCAGWVVALAGYSSTPLEEMDGVPRGDDQQQSGPPFGPRLNPQAKGDVQAKLVQLLADQEAAGKAWQAIVKEAGDYMPQIVARAIVIMQTNAIPFGADDDDPDPTTGDGDESDGPSELPEEGDNGK